MGSRDTWLNGLTMSKLQFFCFLFWTIINFHFLFSYEPKSSDSWVSEKELRINCGLTISIWEKCKGLTPEEKAAMRVTDSKGCRPSNSSKIAAKYGHLVQCLGSHECQRAALRIYFNKIFHKSDEAFYHEQCELNGLKSNELNVYNNKLTLNLIIEGQKYKRKYLWSSHKISRASHL